MKFQANEKFYNINKPSNILEIYVSQMFLLRGVCLCHEGVSEKWSMGDPRI